MASIFEITRGSFALATGTWPEDVAPAGTLAGCSIYITDVTSSISDYLSAVITDAENRVFTVEFNIPGGPEDDAWVKAWSAVPHTSYFRITMVDADGIPTSTKRITVNVV